MTKKAITNVPDSIRHRLLNKSRETGRPYEEFLKYYAIERFLYRLGNTRGAERLIVTRLGRLKPPPLGGSFSSKLFERGWRAVRELEATKLPRQFAHGGFTKRGKNW